MSATNNGKVLKGRDLITIGIFSALYFVINFAFMLLSGLHPLLWILMPEPPWTSHFKKDYSRKKTMRNITLAKTP